MIWSGSKDYQVQMPSLIVSRVLRETIEEAEHSTGTQKCFVRVSQWVDISMPDCTINRIGRDDGMEGKETRGADM